MSNSNNQFLRIVDQIVKQQKDASRISTLEDSYKLRDAHLDLEKAGYKDTRFMHKFTTTGQPTGY